MNAIFWNFKHFGMTEKNKDESWSWIERKKTEHGFVYHSKKLYRQQGAIEDSEKKSDMCY